MVSFSRTREASAAHRGKRSREETLCGLLTCQLFGCESLADWGATSGGGLEVWSTAGLPVLRMTDIATGSLGSSRATFPVHATTGGATGTGALTRVGTPREAVIPATTGRTERIGAARVLISPCKKVGDIGLSEEFRYVYEGIRILLQRLC